MRKLLLEENFNGDSVNENIWNICEYNRMANNEQQAYCKDNVRVENNSLIITSRCENRLERDYTSGKLTTKGKFAFIKGRVEVVAKLPTAVGSWPAIWMMPEDFTGGWPACGEIDIMEVLLLHVFVMDYFLLQYRKLLFLMKQLTEYFLDY